MNDFKDILITFFPILILILMLVFNVVYFENSLQGPNQIALVISTLVASAIAYSKSITIKELGVGVIESIKSSFNAIIILLIIGF